MKECRKLEIFCSDGRKAMIERQNMMIKNTTKTPEPSLLGSSLFSYDISLNSLSLKTDSCDVADNSFQNFSSRSKKPSNIILELRKSNFSEKDKKIFRLMAERREAKMKEAEFAFSANYIWEEDKLRRAKRNGDEKKALAEYLLKKKEAEQYQHLMRQKEKNEILIQEKMSLESRIKEKHEKAEMRQKIFFRKKRMPPTLTSGQDVEIHRSLKRQKDEDEEAGKMEHLRYFEAKEKRSQEKLKFLTLEKNKRLREERRKRELKWQLAKNIREELKRKHEEDQMKMLRNFKRDEEVREKKMKFTTEWKRKILVERNRTKKQEHDLLFTKIKEEAAEKVDETKRRIQAKDLKTRLFQQNRESAFSKSRLLARSSAEFRQKIRSIYAL